MTTFMTAPRLRFSGGSSAKTLRTIARISVVRLLPREVGQQDLALGSLFFGEVAAAGLFELGERVGTLLDQTLHHLQFVGIRQFLTRFGTLIRKA